MLNSNNIKHFIEENLNYKKNNRELISPKNYSWKKLFSLMNKIKLIWHMNINKFDNIFILDLQTLNRLGIRITEEPISYKKKLL